MLSFQATSEEINKAYKTRSLIFHPDRHTDEQTKKDAEKIFVKLRKAHESESPPRVNHKRTHPFQP